MVAKRKRAAASPYHHGDLRNALLVAGRTLLEAKGVTELSLRHVAREVGVSEAAPFRHFADKEAMLAEIAAEGFHELTRARLKLINPTDNAAQAVYRMMLAYVDYALQQPGMFDLMVGQRNPSLAAYSRLSEAIKDSFRVFAVSVHAYARECGWPERALPVLTHAAWAAEHGVATLILSQRAPRVDSGVAIEEMVRASCLLFLRGIAAGPSDDGTIPSLW